MSSTLTGNKIKDSYQALLKIGTNGSLDPITPIAISDGLGNDTPLLLSGVEFKTEIVSVNKNYGLWLDLSSNSHIGLGDYNLQYNFTQLYINDYNNLIQTSGGNNANARGLKFDFANDVYQFGDFEIIGNGNFINIDNTGNFINISSQDGGDFFASNQVTLSSQNKQVIANNGANQIINTSNDNGTYSGERGFRLDFASGYYFFGDYTNVQNPVALTINGGQDNLFLYNSSTQLFFPGPYSNVVLGNWPGDCNNNDAVTNNYMMGTDWNLYGIDPSKWPNTYNTIINCYNNYLDLTEKAVSYNFFSNIKGDNFYINTNPSLVSKQDISNCFIFGVDTSHDDTYFNSYSLDVGETNTNVVLFNGKAIEYGNGTTNIFSVNSSGTFINDDSSGITIFGDFYHKDKNEFVRANHIIEVKELYGINITGLRASARNSFSNVFATKYFDSNANGQVQVEQIQISNYYSDGSIGQMLYDAVQNNLLYVQSNSTYQVEAKIVSTTGNGDTNTPGNSIFDVTWMVCVNSVGDVAISDYDQWGVVNPGHATSFELSSPGKNVITLLVAPDSVDSNACWVKALVTLNCITTG